ncbi:MAG: hypothetical protein ACREFM_05570, partial [Hypericibacter sp.]
MTAAALTVPIRGLGWVSERLGGLLAAERDQWLLWAPVGLGVGVAVYFGLPSEPPLWFGPALA